MPVTAWRVVREPYTLPPYDPFDGKGSSKAGGRWNSAGTPAVYLSDTLSLSILEILVHFSDFAALAEHYAYEVTIPDREIEVIDSRKLPESWHEAGLQRELQALGDEFLHSQRSLALRVPSAVVTRQHNYLLNPEHSRYRELLKIGPRELLPIDRRLFRKPSR
jgi:RES domain-containing protein